MNTPQRAILTDRAAISVTGPDAVTFLQNILTNDVTTLKTGHMIFAALLSPQGKILFDMLISPCANGFQLDIRHDQTQSLIGRLNLYKLHANITIQDQSTSHGIIAVWNDSPPESEDGFFYSDPRCSALGWRAILPFEVQEHGGTQEHGSSHDQRNLIAYHAHRVALGIPEGGLDFSFGSIFPHEANMHQLNGLSFDKGCYIGQEIVARMQYRGTLRKHIVPISCMGTIPPIGSAITAENRSIGFIGSVYALRREAEEHLESDRDMTTEPATGLALLRTDHARTATEAGIPLRAADSIIMIRDLSRSESPHPQSNTTTYQGQDTQ